MTTVLGFDTATPEVAVAVTRDGEAVSDFASPRPDGGRPVHADALLPAIEAAVSAAGGWEAVELIGVGVGPGSFTGLRVGIATARALGQALAKPLAAVGTLDALARGIAERPAAGGRPVLAVIDARRGEAFASVYSGAGELGWGPVVAAPDEIANRVAAAPEPPLAGGDGALRFRESLEAVGAEVLPGEDPANRVSARHLCLLAEEGGRLAPEDVEPIYLRAPDAQLWLQRDRRRKRD